MKRIAGFFLIIFVLFWILSEPTAASSSVSHIVANLRSAGDSMVTFMEGILGGGTAGQSTTTGRTRQNGTRQNSTGSTHRGAG
ncbi:MAG TPA: hypothetical protein VL595_19485 [Pseudonocardia sp.]|nr:hypothetical protein [Pseudonocardia sp.]